MIDEQRDSIEKMAAYFWDEVSKRVFCGVKATGFLFKSYFLKLEPPLYLGIPPCITHTTVSGDPRESR